MEILTLKNNYKVSGRWKSQYCHSGVWDGVSLISGKSGKQVYEEILALEAQNIPNSADLYDQINAVIGNDTWTKLNCSECSTSNYGPMISLDVNGGEYSVNLCPVCLKKALKLLKEAK